MKFVSGFLFISLLAGAGVYLEPNRGQAEIDAAFLARTSGGTVAAGSSAIGFRRRDGSTSAVVFEGASRRAEAVPEQPLPGVSHYIQQADPKRWVWDVPHYGAVRYRGVYPGVDLLYRASRGEIEFDFVLAPGADPSRIQLRVPPETRIDAFGALRLKGALLQAPVAWQNIRGERRRVDVRIVFNRRHRAHFRLGDYDRHFALTIDPVIQFATYLGGSDNDIGMRVISGPDGAIYTAGNTMSADFPLSLSPDNLLNRPEILFQQTVYLARIKADASAIDWSLFLGGSARQSVFALKQDNFGNLYVLGNTSSPNFPVTPGALHNAIDPSLTDLFLVKLDASTGHIKNSTFLGIPLYVNQPDSAKMLAVDVAGGVYVGGDLNGGHFTATPGAFQTTAPAISDFVLRLNPALNAVVYATYWPFGSIAAMEVDSSGNLVIGGIAFGRPESGTPAFPAVNPLPGVNDTPDFPAQAYLARLNLSGTAVTFATLLHGGGRDSGISDLKIASDGSLYAAGWASGTAFPQVSPLTLDPFPSDFHPVPDNSTDSPFLVRLAADGKSLVQSTFFSGAPYPASFTPVLNKNLRLAIQPNGSPCLAGLNTPFSHQTPGGIVADPGTVLIAGGWSLSCVDETGSRVNLRTGLPPTGGAGYTDLTITADGSLLLTGHATGVLITTPGVFQPSFRGSGLVDYLTSNFSGDAFLMRISLDNPVPLIQRASPETVVLDTDNSDQCSEALFGSGFTFGATATVNGHLASYTFAASGTQISFDCGFLQAGDNRVALTLPPPGGGTSEKIFSAINAPPSTISVSPTFVTQGAPETKVVIRATNLTAGSALFWNGSPRAAAYVADIAPLKTGHFELLVEPAELTQPSNAQIMVTNPGPGGGTSTVANFAVEASGLGGVPTLNSAINPLFNDVSPTSSSVFLLGSGFAAGTRAFWDGAAVPDSITSLSVMTIEPPSADLTHPGAHDVYVSNGSGRSASIRVFVGRAIYGQAWYYGATLKRLYVITGSSRAGSDLVVLDATTGKSLSTLSGIASVVQASALSADGHYLFIADGPIGSLATIRRYNTSTGAVDLQWQVPSSTGQSTSGVVSIVTPPDSPETCIVSVASGPVMIFDRGQPRPFNIASLPAPYLYGGYPLFFASATRIYGGTSPAAGFGNPCWTWLDYDAFGISGGQLQCANEPPEVHHDHGVSYLSDGIRTFVTAMLSVTPSNSISATADLANRRVWWSSTTTPSLRGIWVYNMDTGELQLKAPLPNVDGAQLFPLENGAILSADPGSVVRIP